ncbi:MAG: ribulose-phosphate 3-epimerase, partial [Clostridia bacterium]|nr:ribulose-phosphate 3-epimerase [Clostridia bacterium]
SVKPGTPAEAIFPYLELVDMVLVMTVEPGFGGQSFMADMMPKARAIRDEITKRGLDVMVEVDGGISEKNAALCAENGIDVLVSGSTIFGASDATAMIADIRANAEAAFKA